MKTITVVIYVLLGEIYVYILYHIDKSMRDDSFIVEQYCRYLKVHTIPKDGFSELAEFTIT